MKEKGWQKFPVLFSLYIAQSIPMSFFSTVVPVIMRQEKYSLESIGLLQLVKLPWIIKFLWAPMIDNKGRTTKQLKNWIIFSELFYAIIILSIGLFNLQTDFKLIVILMIVAFVASATQDIAVDIFAILLLKPGERSLGNSMQSAGSFVGSLFGTGILLIAYYYFGWTNLLILLATFVVFAIVPLLLYRKPLLDENEIKQRVSLADIYRFFAQKGKHKRVLVLVFYYSGIIGILALLKNDWFRGLYHAQTTIATLRAGLHSVGCSEYIVAPQASDLRTFMPKRITGTYSGQRIWHTGKQEFFGLLHQCDSIDLTFRMEQYQRNGKSRQCQMQQRHADQNPVGIFWVSRVVAHGKMDSYSNRTYAERTQLARSSDFYGLF